jgi:nucleotide-binding universal stress UspA family protein
MLPIKTILHPTDFSENAGFAFRLACALARDYSAKLLLAHVRSLPTVVPPDTVTLPPPQRVEDIDVALRERLRALKPNEPRIAVENYLLIGDEASEIIQLAEQTSADLIVMGTHGRTGLKRLLMGSVAEKVLRDAPCPVVTVREPLRRTDHSNMPSRATATRVS